MGREYSRELTQILRFTGENAIFLVPCDLHVFHPIWVFGPRGGGSPKVLVHNLLLQFFTLGSSKIELFETYFYDLVIT